MYVPTGNCTVYTDFQSQIYVIQNSTFLDLSQMSEYAHTSCYLVYYSVYQELHCYIYET